MERWLTSERNVRICAVLGAIAIAFSSILVRLSHASPSTAAIFRCAYALPVLGLLAWLEDRRLGASLLARAPGRAGARACSSPFDLILWHHSIEDVGAGLATVLANVQVVLVPLVAWAVLSEKPGRQVLAALPLALLGVFLISGVLEHGAYGTRSGPRGARSGSGPGSPTSASCCSCATAGRMCAGPRVRCSTRPRWRPCSACSADGSSATAHLVPAWPGAAWLITLALTSQVLGWLLIISSLSRLPAAITSLLLTVQPVGSVVLAALIFGESPSPLQLAGVVLVLAALLTATRPSRPRVFKGSQAIAGASGSRSIAASMSASENSGSSRSPAR